MAPNTAAGNRVWDFPSRAKTRLPIPCAGAQEGRGARSLSADWVGFVTDVPSDVARPLVDRIDPRFVATSEPADSCWVSGTRSALTDSREGATRARQGQSGRKDCEEGGDQKDILRPRHRNEQGEERPHEDEEQ